MLGYNFELFYEELLELRNSERSKDQPLTVGFMREREELMADYLKRFIYVKLGRTFFEDMSSELISNQNMDEQVAKLLLAFLANKRIKEKLWNINNIFRKASDPKVRKQAALCLYGLVGTYEIDENTTSLIKNLAKQANDPNEVPSNIIALAVILSDLGEYQESLSSEKIMDALICETDPLNKLIASRHLLNRYSLFGKSIPGMHEDALYEPREALKRAMSLDWYDEEDEIITRFRRRQALEIALHCMPRNIATCKDIFLLADFFPKLRRCTGLRILALHVLSTYGKAGCEIIVDALGDDSIEVQLLTLEILNQYNSNYSIEIMKKIRSYKSKDHRAVRLKRRILLDLEGTSE